MEPEPFVINASTIGPTENVSGNSVKRAIAELRESGEIEVQTTPTGRVRLNVPGYKRVREFIRNKR